MKICLGREQFIEVKREMKMISLVSGSTSKTDFPDRTSHLDLTDAIALHAALGEEIKNARK